MEGAVEFNPAQQDVIDQLGASREEWPRFDAVLRHQLRHDLDEGLAPLLPDLPDGEDLFVSKHRLGQAMGCERKFLAELDEDFAWTVPIARGTVAHKAIELSIHWRREPEPLALVDASLARLSEDSSGIGEWLQTVTEVERAELRAEANDRVVKFLECWPPLKTNWRPVTESRLRLEIHDRFILSGKVDLSLGQAAGDRAGKVLVDLKTGGFSPVHLEDLRFYALIETLRIGVPPRRVATYYLDQGRFVPEDVTEAVLHSTVARMIDGIGRIVALTSGRREPVTVPGPACRWCPVLHDCEPGRRHLDSDETSDGW